MKKSIIILLFIAAVTCCGTAGGGYSDDSFIYIDEGSGTSYISLAALNKKDIPDTSTIINVSVYTTDEKSKYIFPADNKDSITDFIFENSADIQNKQILYNIDTNYKYGSRHIKNNSGILRTDVSDNIIIVTEDKKNKQRKFWRCSKTGNTLVNVYSYNYETDYVRWYIDTKSRKIVFIKQAGTQNLIQSVPY